MITGTKHHHEILYHENFDSDSIVTPVNADILEQLLMELNYNKDETEFLITGFRQGFSLGYQGPQKVKRKAPNLKLPSKEAEIILWNKVMKEVKEGRYAGPFKQIPFEFFIQSPIGLVPKDRGMDFRLIFHLSYPQNSNTSVNANTPPELFKVKYPDFGEAIKRCLQEGVGCRIGRSDMKSAFRGLGMKREHFKFLVMKAKSPIDGQTYYFSDKALPFGSSISCSHFQRFSNCITHILKYRTNKKPINYLDDYMVAALMKAICDGQINTFLAICRDQFPSQSGQNLLGDNYIGFLKFAHQYHQPDSLHTSG